ncbi:MAG: RNA pseudouridine synthase [Proteobacteria bacterium]|nr:RNA pseudouridine synthase [Pseudomonadota bacterium]
MPWIVQLDTEWVVVDKPAGLLSVPGRGPEGADCAWTRVRALAPDALVVHRLDMATSGLLLFARGAALQRACSIAFAERRVHKAYVALVEGGPAAPAGQIELPLAADWPNRPRQQVDALRGKPSVTRWAVLAREGRRTRLALWPLTGRSHQLRVHAAAEGWPIVGDRLYGGAAAAAEPRLLLHAHELALAHPLDGRALRWVSPAPF